MKHLHPVHLLAILLIPLVSAQLAGQTAAISPTPAGGTATPVSAAAMKSLARGYDNLVLGMAYQVAYDALRNNTAMDYRGTPDVSMSPGRDEKIIETQGGKFINRGIFQFREEKLFTIILELNQDQLDYYTLYMTFSGRYGDPVVLNPQETIWEDAAVRLILEKPCTIKYLDKAVLEALVQQSTIQASRQEENRQSFIDRL